MIWLHYSTEFDCPEDGLCSNQGICDDSVGSCICHEGFEGTTCKGNIFATKGKTFCSNFQKCFFFLDVSCPGGQKPCNDNG